MIFFGGAFDDLLGAKFNINPEATTENPDTPVLYSYSGGPGSILGIGKTNIFKHRPTYNAIRNYQNLSTSYSRYSGVQPSGISTLLYGDSFRLYSENELTTRRGLYPKSFMNFVIDSEVEFDEELGNVVSKIIHRAPDYTKQNKALRTNLGDPGQHITYAVGEKLMKMVLELEMYLIMVLMLLKWKALDKITALKIIMKEKMPIIFTINDLVQFRIAIVNNGTN